MEITKYVLPVIVGAMSGMILIAFGENFVIHKIYPIPSGTDLYDVDSLAKYVKGLPSAAFICMLANYIICSFLAGLISTLVAQRNTVRPAVVIGIVLTLAGLYYVWNMPYPLWFSIANLLVYLPFALLGYLSVRKKIVRTGS